jgi:uncharacterized membrane protein SpoIIM required for sporulation
LKQEQFESLYAGRWQVFEAWLKLRELPGRQRAKKTPPFAGREAPRRYREICRHLALARSRDYGSMLVDRLHALAVTGHDVLYTAPSGWWRRVVDYLAGGFAREVRGQRAYVLAAALLFFLPYVATSLATRADPDFAYLVMPAASVWGLEEMYSGENERLGRKRDAGTDVAMFGFYIYNNVGIAFRCYAGGVLAGVGTAAALLFNGVAIGTAEGRVVAKGYGENFYSFVAGHSSFELLAIMLAGAAGLRLGWGVIAPGRRPRGLSLKQAGRETAGIIGGAAVMLLIAAAIEAFWSPLKLAPLMKYGVGATLWVVLAAYFLFAGRDRADQ